MKQWAQLQSKLLKVGCIIRKAYTRVKEDMWLSTLHVNNWQQKGGQVGSLEPWRHGFCGPSLMLWNLWKVSHWYQWALDWEKAPGNIGTGKEYFPYQSDSANSSCCCLCLYKLPALLHPTFTDVDFLRKMPLEMLYTTIPLPERQQPAWNQRGRNEKASPA